MSESVGDIINGLIESQINAINTLDIGTITKIYDGKGKVDVELKIKVGSQNVVLQECPLAFQKFGSGTIWIAPKLGQTVLVAFTKTERDRQLKAGTQRMDEVATFTLSNAIVIGGLFLITDILPDDFDPDEICIRHQTGSYIKFKENGAIEIKSPLEVNVIVP